MSSWTHGLAGWVLLLMSLVVCEVALQVADRTSRATHALLMAPWARAAPTLPDGRGNPYHREHDAAGYRNAARPARAEIVVLGDSHAYGAGVAPPEAWPARIGAYNLALPGYGPGHSLLQLDEALRLQPRLLIVAPYYGNDFVDTYLLGTRRRELLAGFDRRAAEEADAQSPIEREIAQLFGMGEAPTAPPRGVRAWISDRVKLYGLARTAWGLVAPKPALAILSRDFSSASAALTPVQRQYTLPVDAGWRTILTPAYRSLAVDDRDPRVRLGFEASVRALREIHARASAASIEVLVVLHPTKESVFWPRGEADPTLRRLVANEARLHRELMATLEADGIAYVDTLPVLRAATEQPYFEDVDGHLNATGHRRIAEAVAGRIR
jgi:hypothetical protein